MIAILTGQIITKDLSSIVLDVHGIGYEVQMAHSELDRVSINDELRLFIHHHIREQSQELFGFTTEGAKALFRQLITVQGVGPKAGMAILSIGEFEAVRSAIARGDAKYIQQASGVGKKTAERICVDLSDKVGVPSTMSADFIQTDINTENEAVEALVALGYTVTDAMRALVKIDHNLSTPERIKQALQKI